MKKLIIVLALLATGALLFAGGKKEATGTKHLVVATDSTFPPMEFVDENKQVVGFDIDMFNAIAAAAGFTVEYKSVAWDGIFAGVAADKYDVVLSSVTILDERKEQMDFSEPYINAGQILVVKADVMDVDELKDLAGKTVGAQIATTGAFEVEKVPEVTLKTYDDAGLAFEDLYNGRIQGVVIDTPVAANYALQNEKYKGTLKIVGKPMTAELYGIVVKKGNKALLDLINKGLKAIQDSGKLAELEDKWLK